MISKKDVISLKTHFPNIQSDLAKAKHMYICIDSQSKNKELVKVQSAKPNKPVHAIHYLIEKPDINRNPFNRTSIIDCDKKFCSKDIIYPLSMRTKRRPDICQSLLDSILKAMFNPGKIHLKRKVMMSLNDQLL